MPRDLKPGEPAGATLEEHHKHHKRKAPAQAGASATTEADGAAPDIRSDSMELSDVISLLALVLAAIRLGHELGGPRKK